ncbi:MAG: hypothetical protein RLZZ15_2176 [Verrucomicrobiota bacterium]|jgi:hypothetical protein
MPFDHSRAPTIGSRTPMKISRPLVLSSLFVFGSGFFLRAAEPTAATPTAAAAKSDATTLVATPAPVAPAKPTVDEKGYLKLGFEQLASYPFVTPSFDPAATPNEKPPTGEEQIPAEVKSWNGKKAVVVGFMVPVKMEKGLVTEFLLMRNTMACCYGSVPNMNEWVIVKMKKGGVQPLMDVPVSFYGDLKVGAMFENGYMTGLYELACDRMGEAQS